MMLKLWKSRPAPSHEDLFIEHYEQLLGWALQLTGRDRQKAEDLVHDVFVQFALVQPALDEVENLEGYLFASMRNLLRSQLRREARATASHLSLIDYDSAETGLRAVDPRLNLRVRDELSLICHYACVRKESSRAGSALILRFFLGYYPGEIARLFRSSRQAVADLLAAARREAKLYLSQPNRLGFMRESPAAASFKSRAEQRHEPEDFIGELRQSIFRSSEGACLPRRKIRDLYSRPVVETSENRIESGVLGHIVSCPRCLDIANRELGLPALSERYPTDTLGPDERGGSGSAGGAASGGEMRSESAQEAVKHFRRRLRDVIEHEPKELHIAVNGRLLGSQIINAPLNEQHLHLDEAERIDFIEVFSEQGIRLCSLGVEPPPGGPFERQAEVILSEQRRLQVSVHFRGPGASLQIAYHDPNFRVSTEATDLESGVELRLAAQAEEMPEPDRTTIFKPRWKLFTPGFWLRPGVLSLAVGLILASALLLLRATTPVSAAELLRKSAAAEESSVDPGFILHRALTLEERNPQDGLLLSRRRVEIWRSAALEARRAYDERDHLIAGEWRKSDGSRILYRRGEQPQEASTAQSPIPTALDDAWRLNLSAKDFSALINHARATTRVEQRGDAYVLRAVNEDGPGAGDRGGLRAATLVMSGDSLRAIEQTLLVEGSGGMREYRFIESRFERHRAETVASARFEPEPELLLEEAKAGEVKLAPENPAPPEARDAASPEPLPSPRPTPAAAASAELEIEALALLVPLGATLGQEVSVARTDDGLLRIEGVVENDERKARILSALAPISAHPAVYLRIETPEEAARRIEQAKSALNSPSGSPSGSSSGAPVVVTIEESAPASSRIPVDGDLRRYLTARGVAGASIDEEINQFAMLALRRSRQALLYAWSLRRLAERFAPAELRALDPAARAKWLMMIGEHAASYEREIVALGEKLSPVFGAVESAASPSVAAAEGGMGDGLSDEANLARVAVDLERLSAAIDESVRSAFTLSSAAQSANRSTTDSSGIKSPQFRRELGRAAALAGKIHLAAQRLRGAEGASQR